LKRLIGIILLAVGIITGSITYPASTHAASQFTGGLLDGISIEIGASVGQSTTTVAEMTDGDVSTRGILSTSNVAWHSFSSPVEISSVVLKSSGAGIIEFYDNQNSLLQRYNVLSNDGIQTLPTPVQNVTTVVLKGASSNINVYEWNVFTVPSVPPTATTINWIQAGDQIVKLDWDHTGAASYNVKRSTSAGGPYTLLANVKGTTYVDQAVTNGTTYYYVVSAVNEAGESSDSSEKSAKPDATQYTGGLLDGLLIQAGKTVGTPTSTVREITDNNTGTRFVLTTGGVAWYTFTSPVEINSVIVNSGTPLTVEFYDASNNLLQKYDLIKNNGIQTLPIPVQDVTTVVLKNGSSSNVSVYEWNVFTNPSAPPLVTTINWIQGGDQIVKLEWDNTGAASYNVKRSTSAGGPYSLLANVKGTTYVDRAVTNGTTYYYVVSAVNEAGESGNSAEKSIKPDATKYTGGLLDGLLIQAGNTVGTPTSTVRELTDNNTSTRFVLTTKGVAWYTFSSPVEIDSVIANGNNLAVEFYDANNNLLQQYTIINKDQVETLPTPIQNVTTVVLKNVGTSNISVYEWNVFGKGGEPADAPMNLTASAGNKKVVLNWTSPSSNVTSYIVKRSLVPGGPYTAIATVPGNTTTYTDTNVVNGTTYYYVVSAIGSTGESANSNEASATPKADVVTPPGQTGERALLRITLNNGIEKEYDLSMAEVYDFINWYEGRANGVGTVMYAFDKHDNNKGPFKSRKDYVFFDKIITFEVNGYDVGTSGPEEDGGYPVPYPEEY
jgi:fibronectin type 3 domain-containing protein